MKLNFKFFEVNAIASLIAITALAIQIAAELNGATVICNWAKVTFYLGAVVGGISVVLGMCDGFIKEMRRRVILFMSRFEKA